MINPILSIIIISFNTEKLTVDCIKSIYQDKGLKEIPFEIIVIDNDSKDNSVKELKKLKYINLIENKENSGFGKANNQGLKIAKGNYILFLNSDTIILHSAISQSLNWLSSHPEASTCTAQLLNKDKTIQASGGYFPNLLNTFTWCFGLDDLPFVNKFIKAIHPHTPNFYTHDNFYLYDHQQDWVTGAFMLIRRPCLDKTGGFDENYFMYGEEVELSYRIKKTNPGYQVHYLVGPQIIHLGGASAINRIDPIINEYLGILSFFKKHKSKNQYRIVKFLMKANAILRGTLYFILGQKNTSSIYFQACSRI
ncbi:MAG: glycosyltransferase family 2 protein [Candidatus Shapirobacteria bacterium]